MSSPETPQGPEAPWVPIHGIVDQAGVSIVETAQAQVAERQKLDLQKHRAVLEETALNVAVQSKLQEAQELPEPVGERGRQHSEYHQKRGELHQDANLLATSRTDANERGWDAHIQLEKNAQDDVAHLDENLPAYVETAARLANKSLEERARKGDIVRVHDSTDHAIAFPKVEPVDPATKNEDVALPEAAGPKAS
jgi:hypothetical protein